MRNYQCTLLPITPCTLKEDDLKDVPELNGTAARDFAKTGILPVEFDNERVVYFRPSPNSEDQVSFGKVRNALKQALSAAIDDLVSYWKPSMDPADYQAIQQAVRHIEQKASADRFLPKKSFWYRGRTNTISNVIVLYFLRPSIPVFQKIEQDIVPLVARLDANQTLGLPIRGECYLSLYNACRE